MEAERKAIRFAASLFCFGIVPAFAQTIHSTGGMFAPRATPAESEYGLSLMVMTVCAAIFLIVGGVLTFTIVRFRRRAHDDQEPPQVYGSNRIEVAWTVIPILIVFVLTMTTARVVVAIQDKSVPRDALHVTVVGHQWWWEVRYPDLGLVTANEIHVPVSSVAKPALTFLRLESADVAHSFWVPQLSGKTDLIPNHPNSMWIDPREEGVFLGNCAEYCGTQHANMMLRVVVESPADFHQWVTGEASNAVTIGPDAARETFLSLSCVSCHAVSGTPAAGRFGPDLSHLMSRATLASGMIPNTPPNLRAWLKDPQAIKPGSLMPNMQLNAGELDDVVRYLSSLK
jgi:cytochrome c oxidase subunit 2